MPEQVPQAEQQKGAEEPKKLTGAELKKQKQAEKQARRAAEKEQKGGPAAGAPNGVDSEGTKPHKQDGESAQQGKAKGQQQQQQKGEQAKKQGKPEGEPHHKRSPSQQQSIPVRTKSGEGGAQKASKKDNKQVQLLSHLYTGPRRHTLDSSSTSSKDIHPSILALGLQISSYEICGSSARCVAMLLAFKDCIAAYTTPTGTSLPRHMVGHYLSPQIEFLKSCRPIGEAMGNAIRWLKKLIVAIDPSMSEVEAKRELCDRIDTFIRERITVTDQAIATSATQQIRPGSVVLTFAKSSIVERTILEAHARLGPDSFRVITVDSRPLFEGKKLATSLMHAGIEVEYLPYSALSHAIKSATVALLGAHSMLSNGRLQSRCGTAALAMQAAKADVPVIVLCESVKFSGKVALDSIVLNEVAPEEELFLPSSSADSVAAKDVEQEKSVKGLQDFREIPNLQLLNLMYDVTPAEYIRMVICEYGSLPPSSVPVVHRLANDE